MTGIFSYAVELPRLGWHGRRARQIRRRAEFPRQTQPAGIRSNVVSSRVTDRFRRDARKPQARGAVPPVNYVEHPLIQNILMCLPWHNISHL